MNHKYENNVCVSCGCKREKSMLGYYYIRSGIHFGYDRPDCIDWELENSKTID